MELQEHLEPQVLKENLVPLDETATLELRETTDILEPTDP